MIRKTSASDRELNSSVTDAGELYDKVIDWLYKRQNPDRAKRYAKRLRQLVEESDPEGGAAFTQECLSLASESEGNLEQAIKHRKNEIGLIRRLYELAQGQDVAHADFLLSQYDDADLRDRLELLAFLYHENGQLDKALSVLEDAKQLCLNHSVEWDAEHILREYLEERPSQTLYLWVSENGTLSARAASSGHEVATPSVNVTRIEQTQEPTDPTKFVPSLAVQHRTAGESAVTIEDD